MSSVTCDQLVTSVTQKMLDSLLIEVRRADAEGDNCTARELGQQHENLFQASVAGAGTTLLTTVKEKATFTPEEPRDHINEVVKNLFIGDITGAVDGNGLGAAGITHVVDLANTICDHNRAERNGSYIMSKETGSGCDWQDVCPGIVSKLVVMVDDVDEAPLDDHFDAMNKFMRSAMSEGGSVFVHCFRGKSRSAACVIQYLMQVDGLNLRQALKLVQEARPCVQLNVGFRKILMALECRLWPDKPPSIKLKLTSRKPVLSSSLKRKN